MTENIDKKVKIENVIEITPHNKAIYEAGKSIMIDSINTGREFCKFMITMSISAIPVYLGLFKFVLPEKYTLTSNQIIISVIPTIIFLIAAIIFAVGYYPKISNFSLDIIEEIEKEREKTIKRRRNKTKLGLIFFIIATLMMIGYLMFILIALNK